MFTLPPPQQNMTLQTAYPLLSGKNITHQNKSQLSGKFGPDHKCQLSFFDKNVVIYQMTSSIELSIF